VSERVTDRGLREVPELDGVGPQVASRLKALGISREVDLLLHRPLRYEDRTRIVAMNRVRPETRVQVEGRVMHQEIVQRRRRMLLVTLADDAGQITLRFFRFYPSQLRMFRVGNRLRCFGDVRFGPQGFEMAHPQCQVLGTGEPPPLPEHLTAIYPVTQGLAQATLAKTIDAVVERLLSGVIELPDPLDGTIDPGLVEAVRQIHRPGPNADLDALIDGHHPAVQRLASEELLAHHLALTRLNRARARQKAHALKPDQALDAKLLDVVGFEPTGAQRRVIAEIAADLKTNRPMRRLLQGDVGSGKTVVGALAALQAVECGRQVALMAPTELLAEQHARACPAGSRRSASTSRGCPAVKGGARGGAGAAGIGRGAGGRRHPCAVPAGRGPCAPGLVIVDEQHRFGVHQRLALREKGPATACTPHQLIMTATPIPRTLAMTAYAGPGPLRDRRAAAGAHARTTVAVPDSRRDEVIERVRRGLRRGVARPTGSAP
jgi:ATP-dependent DNA helicase RecG